MLFFRPLDLLEIYGTENVQLYKSYTKCKLNLSYIYIYIYKREWLLSSRLASGRSQNVEFLGDGLPFDV